MVHSPPTTVPTEQTSVSPGSFLAHTYLSTYVTAIGLWLGSGAASLIVGVSVCGTVGSDVTGLEVTGLRLGDLDGLEVTGLLVGEDDGLDDGLFVTGLLVGDLDG